MATFTLTFNATQGQSITVSGFTFTKSLLDDKVYTCDNPSSSVTTLTGFNTSPYQGSLLRVENIPTTVTSIQNLAFFNCYVLTTISIPTSLISIGENAFFACYALVSITIPANVTSIGNFAFGVCTSLTSIVVDSNNTSYSNVNNDGVLYNFSKTTLIQYPIGNLATSFGIPANVTTIGVSAFQSCTNLTSVDLAGIETIGMQAFLGCTAIDSITIPALVTTIGDNAFLSCSSLTSILVDPNNNNYSNNSGDGVLYDKNITTLIQYPIGNLATSFVIPATVTTIGIYAFDSCINLTSVDLAGIETIGTRGFFGCSAITSITIPQSVTSIGNAAFYSCSSLRNITIPNSGVTIGPEAFTGIPTFPPQQTLQDAATLYTSPLDESTNSVYLYFKQNFIDDGVDEINYTDNGPPPTPIPMVCFLKDSKILTKQGYRPIQDLRKGDLIKTIKHGYLPIDMIGYREIYNPICEERIKDKLYVCSNKEYSEIFEDLVITGCHSILVENYTTQEQLDKSTEVNGGIFETDGKWRLPACVDERAKPYEKEGAHTIYHIALENEDYFMNYGIYANGLIVETCSKRYLKELSNMTIHF